MEGAQHRPRVADVVTAPGVQAVPLGGKAGIGEHRGSDHRRERSWGIKVSSMSRSAQGGRSSARGQGADRPDIEFRPVRNGMDYLLSAVTHLTEGKKLLSFRS
ncbi:hypothetical protein [Streptomyces sp. NPDC056165]|uniref:hypothetical protein n=1 Tax=Streptomyces sp. NPDC056165 TaxID=3345733 RepID=UPI0035DDA99E